MTDSNPQQLTAHALLIGDRINTAGFEGQVLSSSPLAVRVGANGLAVLFRYGVAVFIGLSAAEETEFLERLQARCYGKIAPPEEEWAKIQVANAPAVAYGGQGGMLGIFLSPHYATDHNVYLTYSEPGAYGSGLALARAKLPQVPTSIAKSNATEIK